MDQIGEIVGLRGPSLYRHTRAKQDLLFDIISSSINRLLADQSNALARSAPTRDRFQSAIESYVRYHTTHRREALTGMRELENLDPSNRETVRKLARLFHARLGALIEQGTDEKVFDVQSPRLATYAVLDLSVGPSGWFRVGGTYNEDEVVSAYTQFALRVVGASPI
jgi:AcrR family transcriptional regulator